MINLNELLDLSYVKNYLHIEHNFIEDDNFINDCINIAANYVSTYTGLPIDIVISNSTLKVAILLLISHFYDIRSIEIESNSKMNFALKSILDMHKVNWL